MLVGFVNEGERWPQQGKGVKTTHVKVKKKKKNAMGESTAVFSSTEIYFAFKGVWG